jgi:hypothetical protein
MAIIWRKIQERGCSILADGARCEIRCARRGGYSAEIVQQVDRHYVDDVEGADVDREPKNEDDAVTPERLWKALRPSSDYTDDKNHRRLTESGKYSIFQLTSVIYTCIAESCQW